MPIEFPKMLKGNDNSTSNSGYDWSETTYTDYVSALGFFNKNIGMTIGPVDYIARTYNGGNTWEKIDLDFEGWGNDVAFHLSDPNQVWIAMGDVYFSNNMGTTWTKQDLSSQAIKIWDIYVGENVVWSASYRKDKELFVNRDITQENWEHIQLPLDDNKRIEGVIDGVGDNIIVLPGHYN